MGPAFETYSEKAWLYVVKGFKKVDQPELFIAALAATVELSAICPNETQKYLQEIFKLLATLLDVSFRLQNIPINTN